MSLIPERESYEACYRDFRWSIPDRLNIANITCDRQAAWRPDQVGLIVEDEMGTVTRYRYREIRQLANRLANAYAALGISSGDRIAVVLSQGVECLVAHLAAYKLGAISVPLSPLFGPEGLSHRLVDSATSLVVTDAEGAAAIAAVVDDIGTLRAILSTGGNGPGGELDLMETLLKGSDHFDTADTAATDPAVLIYTSGTTGLPRGVLHAHQVLLGHLPGMEFCLGYFPKPGDLYWSPADWSWVAGLLDVILPGFYHGVPVLARRFAKFEAEAAFDLMARHGVRNSLITPTALKLMRQSRSEPARGVVLRSLCTGGEPMGTELLEWGRSVFGLSINEIYGQTEANVVVTSNAEVMSPRAGAIGKASPGHVVEIVGDNGQVVGPGEQGQIAVRRPNPVMFLEYWHSPKATAEKFIGNWCLTGDLGVKDQDGYIAFRGRVDDVINTSGYRIGPVEIETCLMRHPDVALVGVVGKPDASRGEIIKAFVVTSEGVEGSDSLAHSLQSFVRRRLAAYQYPREIAFLDEMPVTVSGKIRREDLRALG
ncbi:MAG: AMP-dependent synthetase [Rhodospirillaceae bacterium]|nr:AMP-dependent synthetase [Rhodospirillaceae bacterium]